MIIFFLSYQNIKTNQFAQNNLKEAREKLQLQFDTINKQNEEKTMMLKEIHHRVKNNLQVITSLLRLQSRELENEEAISKFQETTNRVIAMSMIHEKMYQSAELSKINIEEYFNSLSYDLLNSYQVAFPIEIKIYCSIQTLGMTPIVPLALIFNELLSNSLKYAFSKNQEAKIDIKLQKMDQNNFVLTYQDNGTWKIPARQDSFGMELIDALTEQLEGKMSFSNKPVTKYVFEFPNLDS
jgi:two-component sensor histidine kinase